MFFIQDQLRGVTRRKVCIGIVFYFGKFRSATVINGEE